MGKNILHFLHIRKTGGTAIKEALKDVTETEKYFIRLHPHQTRLMDIPKGEKAFFFLRDPVARFVSGFNSRLRQGKPRYNSPWNEGEKIAFDRFPSANSLAEALFDPLQQNRAGQAMAEIRHVNQSYDYWFANIEYISSRENDLIFVGFQETLISDFELLEQMLQLPKDIRIPQDDIKSHKTPQGYDTFLSDQSVANLKKWYVQDYAFIDFIKQYKEKIMDQGSIDMTVKYKKTTDRKGLSQPDSDAHALVTLRRDSDTILERTHYWIPPIPFWKALKKTRNSGLRMACVVEDRLYQGLRFEGEVMLLTPDNWKHVLRHSRPDFLLMESIWNTVTGHWHMGQDPKAPGRDELLEIVSLARKQSIPSIFWITRGHEYHRHYGEFARQFDYVFCADPREVDLLRSEGIEADVLLPCVQPAIYNPFRHYEHYTTFHLGILYDGWADLDRMTDDLGVLKEVKPYGLDIIESRYQIFRQRLEAVPDFKDCILGCVSEKSRIQAMKYAKAYITLEKTLSTETTQQWMTLEALACRLPVVHHGSLPENDIRKGVVIECPEQMDFLVEFLRFQEDDLYRERVAHLGWRKTYQEHTFAHRIQKICATIGIGHDWEEHPMASLITPTFRREFLPNCLKNYEQQTYPSKELVLVFNNQEVPTRTELGLKEPRDDVKIANVPGEMFAGACLNQGHILAEGEYFFRVDDDDYYGPNYVLDMILLARCVDADLFGKPPAHVIFQGDSYVYGRKASPPLMIVSLNSLAKGEIWLGGNSFAGHRSFFSRINYSESSYGAADSSLLFNLTENQGSYNIAFMDNMNLVFERRTDQKSHTWKLDIEKFKKSCCKIGRLQDIFV